MGIKKIHADEPDSQQTKKGPTLIKIGLLIFVVAFGFYFSQNYTIQPRNNINFQTESYPVPSEPASMARSIETFEETKQQLKENVSSSAGNLSQNILEQATDQVETYASQSAQTVKSEIYKQTLGSLIIELVSHMPKEDWDAVKGDVCK